MSNIAVQGGATGTGTVTLLAPSTSTDRTLTLPDSTGTVATNEAIAAAGYTTSAGVLTQFNVTGAAPVYACRAWVNFNGTGTVAIRASGNVSSITDHGTGQYTVNFTTALPDADYSANITGGEGGFMCRTADDITARTTTTLRMRLFSDGANNTLADSAFVQVNVFR